jgi:hypothetical protein
VGEIGCGEEEDVVPYLGSAVLLVSFAPYGNGEKADNLSLLQFYARMLAESRVLVLKCTFRGPRSLLSGVRA